MQSKSPIFVVTVILLVPFVYGISSIPDVCAVPPSPGYSESGTCGAKTTNPETGLSQQTCCWKQRTGTSQGPGPEVTVCQTCYQSDLRSPIACSDPVVQAMKLPEGIRPEQEGGVLEDPATSPKLEGNVGPRGEFQELPENNMTLSEGVGPNAGGVFEEPNPDLLKKSPNVLKKLPDTQDPITQNMK